MFNTVIRKCTNCHHEDESSNAGTNATCHWCKEGSMQVIHENAKVDMHEMVGQILKNH